MENKKSIYGDYLGKTVRIMVHSGRGYLGVLKQADFNMVILNPYLADYSTDLVEEYKIEEADCLINLPIQSLSVLESGKKYLDDVVADTETAMKNKGCLRVREDEIPVKIAEVK